jgi:PKD repeat protein
MKNILFIFILIGTFSSYAQIKNVLFLGNSYTGVNNLPQLVKDVALSFGDTIYSDQNTPGGYTYNLHTTNATSLAKIQAQNWDYVILQEQSQIPSLPQSITGSDYSVPHSVTLNNLIKANNPCTETVFYMTWGRENGDASFCAQYAPVCTYSGMQQELRNTYMFMADSNQATVSPVGVAWKTVRDSFPSIQLYTGDGSHPNIFGSYLAACVFYATLYQKSPIGSTFIPAGINTTDALNLQTVASYTVLDSLPLWRINANKPIANFNYSGGSTISFANTSTNGVTYFWDFGDGNTSTLENPNNTYASNNTYPVKLIIFSSDSCFSDTITQNGTIINAGINAIADKKEFIIYPNPTNDFIHIQTSLKYTSTIITDVTGKLVKKNNAMKRIDISDLSKGIYFLQVIDGVLPLKTVKLIKK